MKNNSIHQEVLLMTGTSFVTRQYKDMESYEYSKDLTENEKLIEACWNGLTREIFRELLPLNNSTTKIFLWQVRESPKFFMLEMGEHPADVDEYFTINPYRFIAAQECN